MVRRRADLANVKGAEIQNSEKSRLKLPSSVRTDSRRAAEFSYPDVDESTGYLVERNID